MAAAGTVARPRQAPGRTASRWPIAVGGCVALAALSLLIAAQTTYDPTAWLIWGREIVHGDLSTSVGPSWKPLPILVTAPAALLGDTAQQQIWLVVARAGVLAAVALAYRLAWRLEGPVAGVIAAATLLVASSYLSRTFRGDSEGLLVAIALGAVEAHVSGRRRMAFGLVSAATLLRPELCLFALGYGLWLVLAASSAAQRRRMLAVAAATGALVVACWLVPEQIGSGRLFRAASRALEPVAGSPATAAHPFLATFSNASPALPWPVYVAGVAYVVAAIRDLRRPESRLAVALAAMATAGMVLIAGMAQAGFTGNIRYLAIPIAMTAILGGAGGVHLFRRARAGRSPGRARLAIAVAAAVAAPFAARAVLHTRHQFAGALHESAVYAALPDAISHAGGRAAVLGCGPPPVTATYDVQAVAHALRVHEPQVGITPRVPGTIVVRSDSSLANDRRYPARTRTARWVIATSCGR